MERKNIVNVARESCLPGMMRAMKRASFDPCYQLSVKFGGELAIDDGGPSRELLRLLITEISHSEIFIGPTNAKELDLHYSALQAGKYRSYGAVMAYSVVHGGAVPNFMSPVLYAALTTGIENVQPVMEDIIDYGLRCKLEKLADADESNFQTAVDEAEDIIQVAGCYNFATSIHQKENLIKCLIHFVVLGRMRQCVDQLSEGISTLGLLNEMKMHPEEMRSLFVDEGVRLDAATLGAVFQMEEMSEEGSNTRVLENTVLAMWRDFLMDLEEGSESIQLKDVLVYCTGADSVPPLGFTPQPTLRFHGAAPINTSEDKRNFPLANTCSNILDIPLITEYDILKKNLINAISMPFFTSE